MPPRKRRTIFDTISRGQVLGTYHPPPRRCEAVAPILLGGGPRQRCVLPDGHPDWHRTKDGTEFELSPGCCPTCGAQWSPEEQQRKREGEERG